MVHFCRRTFVFFREKKNAEAQWLVVKTFTENRFITKNKMETMYESQL